MTQISDVGDPRVAAFRDLPSRKDPPGELIVESALAVRRLLTSGVRVEAILAVDKRAGGLDVPAEVPLYTCTQSILDAIVGFAMHRGAIALAQRPRAGIAALAAVLGAPALILCADSSRPKRRNVRG